MPEYYTKNFNLFVALAPVAKTGHLNSAALRLAALSRDEIKFVIVNQLRIFDWFPPPIAGQEALIVFCNILGFVCEAVESLLLKNADVINYERLDVAASNYPSGSSWRNAYYYA